MSCLRGPSELVSIYYAAFLLSHLLSSERSSIASAREPCAAAKTRVYSQMYYHTGITQRDRDSVQVICWCMCVFMLEPVHVSVCKIHQRTYSHPGMSVGSQVIVGGDTNFHG
jgi:hypothetical protein